MTRAVRPGRLLTPTPPPTLPAHADRADMAAGRLVLRQRGASGALLPDEQRVNLFLDGAVVAHFRALAGARGYQTLINEALKQAMQAESIEAVVRQAIREELRRG